MTAMRTLVRLAAAIPLLFASVGATPPDSLASLGGHWHCTVAGGRPAERSYFVMSAQLGLNPGRREVFGREDTTEPDGAPSTSFERMYETGGGVAVSAVEGRGIAADAAGSLRFAGRTYDGGETMELTYTVAGDAMRRIAKRGSAIVDDETCSREAETPDVAACPRPNVPAQTVRTLEPEYPVDAYVAKVKGVVLVRVVLDDRSRVLWADIVRSASPLLNEVAIHAARGSTFRTEIRTCRPVASEYVFSVDFE